MNSCRTLSAALILLAATAAAHDTPHENSAQRLLALINHIRAHGANCGGRLHPPAPPLQWNAQLAQAATAHAQEMAGRNRLSHQSGDGRSMEQRIAHTDYPYRAVGENILGGADTPEEAARLWFESPAHCKNIMDADYTETGIARARNTQSKYQTYWVQDFGGRAKQQQK
ncbi:CAP domain-containing protein [Neisseria bacilliformis]|uniref:CAP domain-containing protein n=1 Tax=Neisseria bacilliformis TaxID=267212 RepID=UPI003C70BCE2